MCASVQHLQIIQSGPKPVARLFVLHPILSCSPWPAHRLNPANLFTPQLCNHISVFISMGYEECCGKAESLVYFVADFAGNPKPFLHAGPGDLNPQRSSQTYLNTPWR
jgi:hypothetical protein